MTQSRVCGATTWVSEGGAIDLKADCDKPANHDDPYAEIGGIQTDPTHRAVYLIDGVTVTITWPSERTR